MIKIAFYIESMVVGGAEKALIDLVNNMDYTKYEVTVIAVFKQSVYSDYTFQFNDFFNLQVKYITLVDNSNKFRYTLFNYLYAHGNRELIYSHLIKERYDIEVAFYEGFPTEFVSHSTNHTSRKYAWLHTDNTALYKNQTQEYIENQLKIYQKFDEVIGVSEAATESFAKLFPGIRHRTIYNFQNVPLILEKSADRTIVLKKESTVFLAVGRLIPVKGFDRLIEAAQKLLCEGYAVQIVIIGDGTEYENLISLIKTYGLKDVVSLLGMQQNPYSFMAQSDYLVCSSRVEGFSLVTAEAIICGLPVLVTDCGGVSEVLGNEKCGLLAENSVEGIYSMMQYVLDHPEQREEYVKACHRRRHFFEKEKRMPAFDELFTGE